MILSSFLAKSVAVFNRGALRIAGSTKYSL